MTVQIPIHSSTSQNICVDATELVSDVYVANPFKRPMIRRQCCTDQRKELFGRRSHSGSRSAGVGLRPTAPRPCPFLNRSPARHPLKLMGTRRVSGADSDAKMAGVDWSFLTPSNPVQFFDKI